MTSTTDRPAKPTGKPPGTGKRTLTRENWWTTVAPALASTPVLLRALLKPKIPRGLREKIMLEVTAVNECGYCEWGHTHLALAQGVSLEEINQIFGYQNEKLKARNEAEASAILFAQHYAERREGFDHESMETLRTYYSEAQVSEILAYLRAITLGNLAGNTLDALLDRLHIRRRKAR